MWTEDGMDALGEHRQEHRRHHDALGASMIGDVELEDHSVIVGLVGHRRNRVGELVDLRAALPSHDTLFRRAR